MREAADDEAQMQKVVFYYCLDLERRKERNSYCLTIGCTDCSRLAIVNLDCEYGADWRSAMLRFGTGEQVLERGVEALFEFGERDDEDVLLVARHETELFGRSLF